MKFLSRIPTARLFSSIFKKKPPIEPTKSIAEKKRLEKKGSLSFFQPSTPLRTIIEDNTPAITALDLQEKERPTVTTV